MDILDITVSVVVALGAILAFVVQRARYLREIEPDLEVTWNDEVFLVNIEDTLKQEWNMGTKVNIENRSIRNHAEQLSWRVDLMVYPSRDSRCSIESTYPSPPEMYRSALLARRTEEIRIMFGTDLAPDLLGELRSYKDELRMEDAGFWARITVEYCSRAEMLLWVLSPWKLTYRWIFRGRWKFRREKYARTVEKFWGFVRDEPAKPPYSYRKWNFPLKSLARDQRPSLS